MHKDKISGLQLGADDYLQKPFHLDELKLRISYHLELRKKIQEEFLRNFKISSETELAVSVDDKFLQNVFSHIEEHLHDDQFGVEKLSRLAGMSRKHLNNKIKSLTNQTSNDLIRSFRLRKASYLLSEKGFSVSEACYQVGFNNLSYFSKCFNDFYGKRPSEYCR
jgi:AraC-like DNA-binding protein